MTKTNEEIIKKALSDLPFWDHLKTEEKDMIANCATIKDFAKNQLINSSDEACMGVVFVLTGGVRVCLISDEGREITLYRLPTGECCVTTASCVISQITFDTVVTATEKTSLLVIPAYMVARMADLNIYFRSFLFETETERFSQAIWAIQQILFRRFDQRLAGYLIDACEKTGKTTLKITQEEIARDVNSAREVVARMLGHFAAEGLVELQRGRIVILDMEKLKELI